MAAAQAMLRNAANSATSVLHGWRETTRLVAISKEEKNLILSTRAV
jgi:hypothetical protein